MTYFYDIDDLQELNKYYKIKVKWNNDVLPAKFLRVGDKVIFSDKKSELVLNICRDNNTVVVFYEDFAVRYPNNQCLPIKRRCIIFL